MAKALTESSFSERFRYWRKQRGLSQLDLSLASDVSQRHISFLESGRSKPSREMVLQLATILEIPFREQNHLLTAAGFAPVFTETDLSAPDLAPVRQALDFMLRQQEPYPAMVMDQYWNQIESNQAAQHLIAFLLDDLSVLQPCLNAAGQINLVQATLHPEILRPLITNWEDVASHLIRRIHRETLADGKNEISQQLFATLMEYPDVAQIWQSKAAELWQVPILTANFKKAQWQFKFFSTIATLGTPNDITLQELRIECMFPADEETALNMQRLLKS